LSHQLDIGEERGVTLVERARTGDAAAFGQLSARHQAQVFAICLRWTGNAADAEDLTQETLLKAHARLAQVRDPARFAAWLARIAVNTCRNWRTRDRQPTLPMEAAPPGAEQGPDINAGLAERLAIREALTLLPPDVRLAIQLFYLHGMTLRELAQLWRLPESTVKSRLDAGRRRIRKEMETMGLMPATEPFAGEVDLPNARIVVADPDTKAARDLCAAFKANGSPCTVVPNGERILSRLRRLMPCILILHAGFDALDEFEIVRAMRIEPRLREIPIVLLAPKERANEEHIRRAWESGLDCYLTKPYDLAELQRFVTTIDNRGKAAAYRTLAIEHAWRQETPQVLRYLEKAVERGGQTATEAIKDDRAFNYIRHLDRFQALVGNLPASAE
jgi:RNA polymerase sigma-70 factor (ECF subfamily)